MRRITTVATLVLGLALPFAAWARDDKGNDKCDQKGKAACHEKNAANEREIHGVLAGVTVVGETLINPQTDTAKTAEVSYLTIVGEPVCCDSNKEGHEKQKTSTSHDSQASNEKSDAAGGNTRDTEVQRTSGEKAGGMSGDSLGKNDNIYLIAVPPSTKVCDSAEGKGESKKECEFANLELGDRVEVTFKPIEPPETHLMKARHGRHRVIEGEACSITVVHKKRSDLQNESKPATGEEKPSGGQSSDNKEQQGSNDKDK